MNQHETITSDIHRAIDGCGDVETITPETIADALIARYGGTKNDPYVAWGGREHFKHMARQALASKFDITKPADDDETGELFADKLQGRYPVPTAGGGERGYKRLDSLSETELAWNVRRLRRAGRSLLAHANALEAYGAAHHDPARQAAA